MRVKILLFIVGLFFVSCGRYDSMSFYNGSESPLSKKELESVVAKSSVFRDTEAFFFLPDNKLLYYDVEKNKKIKSMWMIKTSKVPHRNFIKHSMLCFAVGRTNKTQLSSVYLPCMRLFHERSNIYLGSTAMCKMGKKWEQEELVCDWQNRTVGWYRIRDIDTIDKKKMFSKRK